MKKYSLIVLFFMGCISQIHASLLSGVKSGIWRATLDSPGGALPFGLDIQPTVNGKYAVYILNGKERLKMDDGQLDGDSLRLTMSIFEAEIVAKVSGNTMTGYWQRKLIGAADLRLPLHAEFGKNYRFVPDASVASQQVEGKWATQFYVDKDSSEAVGIFEQKGNRVSGTFLTTTGDYRYLDGNVVGDSLFLSTFDGTHVYLFKTKVTGNQMIGGFYYSVSGFEQMKAQKNPKATLPDANTLTYLKKGYERISFRFPNLQKKLISIDDAQYKGKVVIIQLMGSWCPNCMDETNFLSPWHKRNRQRGVEIIGLAYERSADFNVSAPKLERLKKRFAIEYEVLLAGNNDKTDASVTLPMLNRVLAFPTTIIIDKKGKVRQIHTGFSGPGTGKYYDKFVDEFNRLVDKLVAE